MTALAAGVPLALLADLLDPAGPPSREIYGREMADLSWLRELAYPLVTPGQCPSNRAIS